jgi:hypothetical protein
MTSVKGAGFQSRALGTSGGGKPMNPLDAVAARTGGPAPPLADKAENSPEEAAKEMELKVHALIEACAKAAAGGDFVMALERAKEAGRKERQLVKFKDGNGLADSISMDLTYCCAFNLAHAVSAPAVIAAVAVDAAAASEGIGVYKSFVCAFAEGFGFERSRAVWMRALCQSGRSHAHAPALVCRPCARRRPVDIGRSALLLAGCL